MTYRICNAKLNSWYQSRRWLLKLKNNIQLRVPGNKIVEPNSCATTHLILYLVNSTSNSVPRKQHLKSPGNVTEIWLPFGYTCPLIFMSFSGQNNGATASLVFLSASDRILLARTCIMNLQTSNVLTQHVYLLLCGQNYKVFHHLHVHIKQYQTEFNTSSEKIVVACTSTYII